MEMSLNKTQNTKRIFLLTTVIAVVFALLSVGSYGFADSGKEVASVKNMNTAIIEGSEDVPHVSVGSFFTNIWKNTGIYKMVHKESVDELNQNVA